jgi:pilus assembly protein CpaE
MTPMSTKVLVVDDNEQTRDKLIELLRFDDVEVVGESTYGAAAYTWANQLDVDVIIVATEEPVARSLRTVEALTNGARSWPIVGVSTRGDREIMRKAMISGVRDFLVMPAPAEELRSSVVNVRHVDRARRAAAEDEGPVRTLGTVITVAGFKGGIGKSSVAANVAVALAQQTRQHAALIDFDLQFGDAAVMLDVVPASTIEHVAGEADRLDPQLLQGYLATHPSRLKLLAAPSTPSAADDISDESASLILEHLAATNDFVVVDTAPHLDGLSVAAMDLSTIVLVVMVPEIPCIRRTKAALTLMQSWGYSRDKVKLILNRGQRGGGLSISDIEAALNYPVFAQIPEDRSVAKGIAIGTPVAMSAPNSRAGRALNDLARTLSGVPRPRERFGSLMRRPSMVTRMTRPKDSQQPVVANSVNWAPAAAPQASLSAQSVPQAAQPQGAAHDWTEQWALVSANGGAANGSGVATAHAPLPRSVVTSEWTISSELAGVESNGNGNGHWTPRATSVVGEE